MREEFEMGTDEKEFEAAVTRALEQKPAVMVPLDFAAKVRASLPAQKSRRTSRFAGRSLGRTVAAFAAAGLVVALCLLAPHARPSFESVAFDMEMLVLMELAGVAAWLGRARSKG